MRSDQFEINVEGLVTEEGEVERRLINKVCRRLENTKILRCCSKEKISLRNMLTIEQYDQVMKE